MYDCHFLSGEKFFFFVCLFVCLPRLFRAFNTQQGWPCDTGFRRMAFFCPSIVSKNTSGVFFLFSQAFLFPAEDVTPNRPVRLYYVIHSGERKIRV